MISSVEHSGWNPSYSICSLLLQVQNFLCDPDMPESHLPNKEKIDQLMKSMETYEKIFYIKNDNKTTKIVHTWKQPYPEMYFKKDKIKSNDNNNNINNLKNDEIKMQQLKENLTCFMLKLNYIDDPDILLGYPIVQKKIGFNKNKIELYPIPELLTYDGYMAQIGKQNSKLDFYFDTNFKSANNEFYNYWIPIYIDEKHYNKNKTTILNSFSIIKYGPKGIKEYDFNPEQIFEILPIILNKMIIGMFNGKSAISSAFIRCYFQFVLLFKKLCLEFEKEYIKYMYHILSLISKNKYNIEKTIVPDIGNFLMLLFFSNKNTHTPKMKKMWYCLFEELLTRQMFWLFHGGVCQYKTKDLLLKKFINNNAYLDYYNEKNVFPEYKTELNDNFIKDLKNNEIYEQIVDIICTDKDYLFSLEWNNKFSKKEKLSNKNDIKNKVNADMSKNFGTLFKACSDEGKKAILEIISSKLKLIDYFNLDISLDELLHKKSHLYNTLQVDKLLKQIKGNNNSDILEYFYKSQRGNSLLLITFFAQKKIEENGFMDELEKNYGIYLDVDNFIKDMKNTLNEIKSFSALYEYVGSEFGKDKNDLDLTIEGYKRAKKKKYIK